MDCPPLAPHWLESSAVAGPSWKLCSSLILIINQTKKQSFFFYPLIIVDKLNHLSQSLCHWLSLNFILPSQLETVFSFIIITLYSFLQSLTCSTSFRALAICSSAAFLGGILSMSMFKMICVFYFLSRKHMSLQSSYQVFKLHHALRIYLDI